MVSLKPGLILLKCFVWIHLRDIPRGEKNTPPKRKTLQLKRQWRIQEFFWRGYIPISPPPGLPRVKGRDFKKKLQLT
jgi:hypothetical protein